MKGAFRSIAANTALAVPGGPDPPYLFYRKQATERE